MNDALTLSNALAVSVASGFMSREHAKNVWVDRLRQMGLTSKIESPKPIDNSKPKVVVPPKEDKEENK